jgi:hypothetical protein
MFQKGTITIKQRIGVTREFEDVPVSAMVSEAGIAYHETLGDNDSWCISHVPSGRMIMGYLSKRTAQRVATDIEQIVDWLNTPLEELSKADILKERIKRLARS